MYKKDTQYKKLALLLSLTIINKIFIFKKKDK